MANSFHKVYIVHKGAGFIGNCQPKADRPRAEDLVIGYYNHIFNNLEFFPYHTILQDLVKLTLTLTLGGGKMGVVGLNKEEGCSF